MKIIRPANERGLSQFDWLKSRHSFSFGTYFDPRFMGFSALKVINDDTVAAAAGFDGHGHRDMEIISYILEGAIEHRDNLGNHFVVSAGEIQHMSAGSGIRHAEFNHSTSDSLHFLQIWIEPNRRGIRPHYQQKAINPHAELTPLVTADGRDGSLQMQQDANLYQLRLRPGQSVHLDNRTRPGYLHIISGGAQLDNQTLLSGDGLMMMTEQIKVTASEPLDALWFDLPNQYN